MSDTFDPPEATTEPARATPLELAGSKLLGAVKTVAQAAGILKGLGIADAIAKRGHLVEKALATVGVRRPKGLGALALFGAGVVVGASAGVLFAPMSGAELRRQIKGYFRGGRAATPDAAEPGANGAATNGASPGAEHA